MSVALRIFLGALRIKRAGLQSGHFMFLMVAAFSATPVCAQSGSPTGQTDRGVETLPPVVVEKKRAPEASAPKKRIEKERKPEPPSEDRAQEAPQTLESQKGLASDQVTTTSTRSEVLQSRAPASITVIRGEKLDEPGVTRIGDALTTTPGIYARGSAFGFDKPGNSVGTITMRGVGGTASSARNLFLIDGVPVNSPYSGTLDYSSLPLLGVDRVEVTPGPFSALYGSNAIGGVINILTKEPAKREMIASGTIGGGGAGRTERGAVTYRDALPNGFGIAVDFAYTNSGGYADDMAVKTGATKTKPAGPIIDVTGVMIAPTTSGGTQAILGDRGERPWSTLNTGVRLYYRVSEDTKLSAGVSFAESYNGYGTPRSAIFDATTGQPVYNGVVRFKDATGTAQYLTLNGGTNPFLNFVPGGEDAVRSFVRGETSFGDLKLKADVSHAYVNAWFISPVAASTLSADGRTFGGPGTYSPSPSQRVIGTVQGEVPLTSWDVLTVGVQSQRDWFTRDIEDLAFQKDPESNTGAISYHSEGQAGINSVFVQNKTDLLSNLSLYLGGRYDAWSTEGRTNQQPTAVQATLPRFAVNYPERTAEAFSPKASVVFLPIEEVTLRASIGQAFRTPDLAQLYSRSQTTLTSFTDASPDLKPERATAWEAGGEWRPIRNRLKLFATYYENDVTDLIYTRTVSSTQQLRTNAGEAMIKGVEFGGEYNITSVWGLYANAAHNQSEILKNVANPASVGKTLTYSPEWTANAGVTYKEGRLSALLSGRYVSKVFVDDQNRDVAEGYPGFYDPYFTIDGKVSYEFTESCKLSLVGTNLLDKGYYQSFLQPGRTILGEVSYRW
jgi:iron complex outermembrane recepter protein